MSVTEPRDAINAGMAKQSEGRRLSLRLQLVLSSVVGGRLVTCHSMFNVLPLVSRDLAVEYV